MFIRGTPCRDRNSARRCKSVKALQEHLGVLHDADVLVPQLLEHLARVLKSGYGLPCPPPMLNQQKAKHKRRANAMLNKVRNRSSRYSDKTCKLCQLRAYIRVDYAACEGLLTLCTQLRADRDARYAQLAQEWQRQAPITLFERLRDLLAKSGNRGRKETRRRGERKNKESSGDRKRSDRKSKIQTQIPHPSYRSSLPILRTQ